MNARRLTHRSASLRINVTPMIDVVMVLIIFYLLVGQLAAGRRLDPDFSVLDPLAPDAPRDLVWGKSWFVFEELERRFGPGAMASYFRTKRALLAPDRPGYTMDDCVAVWSRAVGEDLFAWFRSLAFDVSAGRTELWPR